MIKESLKSKVISGSFWSFLSSGGQQVLGVAVFIILSRQLSPTEFGVMAVAVIFCELGALLAGLGLTEVLVRTPKLTDNTKDSAFWLAAFLGAAISLLLYFSSSFITSFFSIPEIEPMLQLLAILPFSGSLICVHNAILERDFRFKEITIRRLTALLIGSVIAILMVLNGFGVYSLIFQRIFSSFTSLIITWRLVRWRPHMTFSIHEAVHLCRTGIPLVTSTFLLRASTKVKEAIIGLFLGPAALGYMRIAGKLIDFIVQFTISPIVSISLSTFSKLQDDHDRLHKGYRKLIKICGIISIPSFIGLAVIAPELILSVFGEKWQSSVKLMQILCIASLGATLNYFFKPLMIALNKTTLVLKIITFDLIFAILITLVAAQHSLVAVMIGIVISSLISTVIRIFYIRKILNINLSDLFADLFPPTASSLVMGGVIIILKPYLAVSLAPILLLISMIVIGSIAYPITLFILFPRYTIDIKNELAPLLLKRMKKTTKH